MPPGGVRADPGPQLELGADGHRLVDGQLAAAPARAGVTQARGGGLFVEGHLVLETARGLLHHSGDAGAVGAGKGEVVREV